jgi:hypothetical protein
MFTYLKDTDMKKIIPGLAVMTMLFITAGYAQDAQPIDLYGFFQSKFTYIPESPLEKEKSSFSVQQMNLMFRKELGQDFTAFVNLQLTNSFSTERSWGAMDIEEAWMSYKFNDEFSVKAGLLIPTFNNLNEIKNRTPLLPYIIRPSVYESSMGQLVSLDDFVPQRAYIQISGTKMFEDLKLDYALYVGNSDPAYLTSSNSGTLVSGNDTSMFKLIGGRLGIRTGSLKAGISGTYDREKVEEEAGPMVFSAGDVPRVRIGGDVSFKAGDFNFEGEFILCRFSMSDQSKAVLRSLVQMTTNPFTGKSPFGVEQDENFYYVNLMYDINEYWFVYGGGSYLQDAADTYFADGMILPTIGGGFRPIDSVIIKGQYVYVEAKNKDIVDIKTNNYNIAVSIVF